MSMVYDAILVGIVAVCVIRGWLRGFAAALLRLLGWIVAAVLVARFAEPWARELYDGLIEPRVVRAVAAAIPAELVSSIHSGADALQAVQRVVDSLPGLLGSVTIDPSVSSALAAASAQDTMGMAAAITQTVLEPTLLSLTRTAVSAVILIVCPFVFNLLSRLARGRRRDSILSHTNAILGGAVGLAEAFAAGYLYTLLLSVFSQLLTVSWLTPEVLENTRLVSRLMRI